MSAKRRIPRKCPLYSAEIRWRFPVHYHGSGHHRGAGEAFDPDEILYVVDKRQEMHFVQVFRCARKTGLVKPETRLSFLGFGTMNGKDGKPFKTREGGVMRLERLISEINGEMYKKIVENRSVKDTDAEKTAEIVGLSAIKYGDLSNQASKDYVFDVDRFTSFEGNTGPYILYTIVRIKSILNRYLEEGAPWKTAKSCLRPVREKRLLCWRRFVSEP